MKRSVTNIMKYVAAERALNTDFQILINPTGKFEVGGPFADCGVTGRKLACDSYGGVARIGGGSYSGKDPSKVDRSGAYMARKIARDIVKAGYADKVELQIAYAIGIETPVSIHVECFGTEHQEIEFIEEYIANNYDLTPRGIIKKLNLLNVDYNKVSTYGHFGYFDPSILSKHVIRSGYFGHVGKNVNSVNSVNSRHKAKKRLPWEM